jgi:hypothetical protein
MSGAGPYVGAAVGALATTAAYRKFRNKDAQDNTVVVALLGAVGGAVSVVALEIAAGSTFLAIGSRTGT